MRERKNGCQASQVSQVRSDLQPKKIKPSHLLFFLGWKCPNSFRLDWSGRVDEVLRSPNYQHLKGEISLLYGLQGLCNCTIVKEECAIC